MSGPSPVRRTKLHNPVNPTVIRLPKLASAIDGIRISAGSQEFAFTLAGRQLILKRKGGSSPHIFTDKCTVGRDVHPTVTDYSLNDPTLSGMHFSVRLIDDSVEIVDHGSTNGTLVQWVNPGEFLIRRGLDDPEMKLIIDRNVRALEDEQTAREMALYGDVEFRVTEAGGLERIFEEEEGICWVNIEKHDGLLQLSDMSDRLTGLRLCAVYRSLDQYNHANLH